MRKIIFLINLLFMSFSYQVQANNQSVLLNHVMEKFKTDQQSLEEYSVLGKIYCYEKTFMYNTDAFFQMSATYYNSLRPFTRLINRNAIERSINTHLEQENLATKLPNNAVLSIYDKMNQCDLLFTKENAKTSYINLVTDADNYNQPVEGSGSFSSNSAEAIEQYRNDYLNHYFINIPTT